MIDNNNWTKDELALTARKFLARAKRDQIACVRLIGDIHYTRHNRPPNDPGLCIFLLQQACEKAVKSVAIASGQFNPQELVKSYKHDSLLLWIDLYLKLINLPSFVQSIDIVKSRLGSTADKLVTVPEANIKLQELKQNTRKYYDNRPVEVQDWLKEFATLPPTEFALVVMMLENIHRNLASGIYRLLEPEIVINLPSLHAYIKEPNDANLKAALAPSFRQHSASIQNLDVASELMTALLGTSFDQALASAAAKELLDSNATSIKIGKRSIIEKNMLSGFALSSLMFVSALTFPHEQTSRYPSLSKSNSRDDLDCDSYNSNLGIVFNLQELCKLIGMILGDLDEILNMNPEMFKQLSSQKGNKEEVVGYEGLDLSM
jgi:hypothetical protein